MANGWITRLLLLFVVVMILLPVAGHAQPGIPEFGAARKEVNKWFYSLADLIYAIGAIAGMLGGARVYANWQAGRRHVDQEVMSWLFACIFLSLAATALKALYGVN